ncbi:MAG TPA: hypothetical protein VE959_37870 [Bryobacteraceae bacterium]|nr:hypothetical protein [Bryobacteraceae bacterium]
MTPVPLDLPLRTSEAAELANLIFDQAERKALTEEVRNRLAARASVLRLETITPWFGSLARDPVHPSSYYVAVDGARGEPLLLHVALATAPTSSIFYKPLLIGRMRRPNGFEMVLNAVPFGAGERERLEQFAQRIDTAFLPRPQGIRTAIAIEPADPEKELPGAFEAFRAVWKRTGKNVAAMGVAAGTDARRLYSAGLWAAIRAGWREGFSAGVKIAASETPEPAREAIREAAAFTRFAIDIGPLLRPVAGGGDTAAEEKFEAGFSAEDRGWMFDEFGVLELTPEDVVRLAVKFGPGLQAAERLHETIRQARAAQKTARPFDFELSIEQAAERTTAEELMFCLHWLKARGHAAQLAAPRVAGPASGMADLAAVARRYQCVLSLEGRPEHGPEELDAIARATAGRVNYRVPGAEWIAMAAERLLG